MNPSAIRNVVCWFLVLCCSPMIACRKPSEDEKYWALVQSGRHHFLAGEWAAAAADLEKVLKGFPQTADFLFDLARSYACLGEQLRAVDCLERAVAAGYDAAEEARLEPSFQGLRESERFRGLLGRMEDNARQWEARTRTIHNRLDPDSAPAFSSLRELTDAFKQRGIDGHITAALAGKRGAWLWRCELLDQEVSGLRRYLRDHPRAEDREDAGLVLLSCSTSYKPKQLLAFWDGDGALAVETAEWFLREFPESRERSRAEYFLDLARWFSRTRPSAPGPAYVQSDFKDALDRFAELVEKYPKSREAALALGWQAALSWTDEGDVPSPAVRALYSQSVQRFGSTSRAKDFFMSLVPAMVYQIEGVQELDAVDMTGKRWNSTTTKGKVLLVSFWATWCTPCLEELTTIRQAWSDPRFPRHLESVFRFGFSGRATLSVRDFGAPSVERFRCSPRAMPAAAA